MCCISGWLIPLNHRHKLFVVEILVLGVTMKTLGLLKERHLNFLITSRAVKHSSEFTAASLFSSIVSSGYSIMTRALAEDMLPITRDTHALLKEGEELAIQDLSRHDHTHQEYLRYSEAMTATGLVIGTETDTEGEEPVTYLYAGPASFALKNHEHEYARRNTTVEKAAMLGNNPPSGFSSVIHSHDDEYHTKVVDRAFRIGGKTYRELAKSDHDHGYEYHLYKHEDPVKDVDAFWDPRLEIPILPEDLAARVHQHPSRYFTKEQAHDIFFPKNEPYPDTALVRMDKYTVDIAAAVGSVVPGSTNFTKLCLPGQNKDITSNVSSRVQEAVAEGSHYVLPTYVDLFVYPGSYVTMTVPYPVIAVMPASYAFEHDDRARGAQEYVYPFWKGTEFGVYLYDYPDIEESPYVRLFVFIEVPLDMINVPPELIPGQFGVPGITFPDTYFNSRARIYGAILPSSDYVFDRTLNLSFRLCLLEEFVKEFTASGYPGSMFPTDAWVDSEIYVRKLINVSIQRTGQIYVRKFGSTTFGQPAAVHVFKHATYDRSLEDVTVRLYVDKV